MLIEVNRRGFIKTSVLALALIFLGGCTRNSSIFTNIFTKPSPPDPLVALKNGVKTQKGIARYLEGNPKENEPPQIAIGDYEGVIVHDVIKPAGGLYNIQIVIANDPSYESRDIRIFIWCEYGEEITEIKIPLDIVKQELNRKFKDTAIIETNSEATLFEILKGNFANDPMTFKNKTFEINSQIKFARNAFDNDASWEIPDLRNAWPYQGYDANKIDLTPRKNISNPISSGGVGD